MIAPMSNDPIVKLYEYYREYDKLIADTKWWQFFRRSRLKNELLEIKAEGFKVGAMLALQDFAKAGKIKKLK